ncbi:hypothetical protein [Alteribacillus iranensis]|uniref:Uncharacterized protein n=1 Tax=Alteribacillus iranensis TaxID=930128 RepID=A0A1I2ELB1_9BACI|nr:hypothetical protein [Alteribacillus iranensis]SFE93306.1 hypothetical protein SAMN05192532_10672 [Alteribacillus iranensis]
MTIIGAAILPFLMLYISVRLTHSFLGGILVTVIVTIGTKPWDISLWTGVVTMLSLLLSIPVIWNIAKKKKKGP